MRRLGSSSFCVVALAGVGVVGTISSSITGCGSSNDGSSFGNGGGNDASLPGVGAGDGGGGLGGFGDDGGTFALGDAAGASSDDATISKKPVCGDGVLDPGESCDPGSDVGQPKSGCSTDCKTIDPGYVCPKAGVDCSNTWICGDGKVEGAETCDDGNKIDGDGCSYPACAIEAGYKCTLAGVTCTPAACGDGIVAKPETCDVGATTSPGCVNCQLSAVTTVTSPSGTAQPSTVVTNYNCSYPTPATTQPHETCAPTTCGNGTVDAAHPAPIGTPEGTEQCDDGNTRSYDGCDSNCRLEPSCPNGVCVAVCGDGLVFDFDGNGDGLPDEQCDDGNTVSGDGCSSSCQQESGYSCTLSTTTPAFVDVPVVYRDMLHSGNTTPYNGKLYAHPDFENYNSGKIPDLTMSRLTGNVPTQRWDGAGKDPANPSDMTSYSQSLTNVTKDFDDWYRDDVIDPDSTGLTLPRGVRVDGQDVRLTLVNGTYVFDSACDAPYGPGRNNDGTCPAPPANPGGFFPIDGKGWNGAPYNMNEVDDGHDNLLHNFSFTTQFRYYFTYDASSSASLAFSGDDDVWVFFDGQLVVDIGGVHGILPGSYTLDSTQTLGLIDKHVYEVDLFNAERHTHGSNFKLSLTGFVKKTSVCTPTCGDGIRTANEQCDDGSKNVSPSNAPYGSCTTNCTLGPYCGDDIVQSPPEQCDDGVNLTPYAANASSTSCAPGCTKPAYCGDGVLQASFGEVCDNGTKNSNDGTYDGCTTTCALGPHCGDGVVQNPPEGCDDGNRVDGDGCNADCQPEVIR